MLVPGINSVLGDGKWWQWWDGWIAEPGYFRPTSLSHGPWLMNCIFTSSDQFCPGRNWWRKSWNRRFTQPSKQKQPKQILSFLFPGPYSVLGGGGSGDGNGGGVGGSQSPPKRKRSWSRAVFSNLQRKGLEKRFEVQKYVTKPDRRQLAAMLGLTDAQVRRTASTQRKYHYYHHWRG